MKKFGELTICALILIINMIIESFVFMQLWKWFTVPIFHVQTLNIFESMGILLLLAFVFDNSTKKTSEMSIEYMKKKFNYILSIALTALLLGYSISLLI